jgi:competence protein ComFC
LLSGPKKFLLKLVVHRCSGCGCRMDRSDGSFCRWCRMRMFTDGERVAGGIRVLTAFLHSGVVREMVLRLKYKGEKHLSGELSRLALRSWIETPGECDTIIPVPASRERLRKRGYNQAALLASAVASRTGAFYRDILVRKDGDSQIGVSGTMRPENIRGKFAVERIPALKGRVWLIDDVMTTGATITELISTLSDKGVCEVQPAVVCFRKLALESIIPAEEVGDAGVSEY